VVKPNRAETHYLNFTKRALETLPAKEKRYNCFDDSTRCLGIAVYPSGVKTFFHLRKVQGWPQRTTIGAFPDLSVEQARGKAAELNSNLTTWKTNNYEGPNPVKAPSKVPTLGDVLESYLEKDLRKNAKNPDRTIKGRRWQFDFYLSSWRNRPLSSIHRADVIGRHAEIGEKHGEVTANRVIQFLRKLFNHANDPDFALWDGANPCAKPNKFLFHEHGRKRTIEDGEKPKFFKELEKESNQDLRDFLLIALTTGARRGTILAMRWAQIDWQRELWTIPDPKGRKKDSDPHTVPLTKLAVAVLRLRPKVNEWVFPGRKEETHLTTVKKPWKKFIERTDIKDLTVHDLRRTLATQEGETGASTEAIQKTLGHEESSAATKIYDRSQRRDEVREAMTTAMSAILAAGKTSKRKLLAANKPVADKKPKLLKAANCG
jgi:integrase